MRHASATPKAVQQPEPRVARRRGPSVQLRRFDGPLARELFLLSRPDPSRTTLAGQVESVYLALARALTDEGASARDVVRETLLLGEESVDPGAFLRARGRALDEVGLATYDPATTLVGQPSANPEEQVLLLAWASIEAAEAEAAPEAETRSVRSVIPCSCVACGRVHGRSRRCRDEAQLWSGSIYGTAGSMFDETTSLFHRAQEVLQKEGLGFGSVVRTWIYLRDIERDYVELNRARRAFFERAGVTLPPASTGIEGRPLPPGHRVSMSFHAFGARSGEAPRPMTTPTLNEAPTYGSDFSRGMRLTETNKVSLHVSGTASIDERGRTAHPGDFDAQVDRMLLNISVLLEREGAGFGDVVSAVTYLRSALFARRYHEILEKRGLVGFPHAVVEASVCRPDLLCEMEAQAVLPGRG